MKEEIYNLWCEKTRGTPLYDDLMRLGEAEKEDAFYRELAFGTGGLRGVLGAGTNRMNVFTVARATAGLAAYLCARFASPSAVIAYDSRHMSREFAFVTGRVLRSRGVRAYVFPQLMPTPVLSFAVRHLGASAGVVITASHNPREYNGYKVYNEHGCQITDGAAAEITACIRTAPYFAPFGEEEPEVLSGETLKDFLKEIGKLSRFSGLQPYAPSVVYTPLNGTGNVPVRTLFAEMGLENVTVVPEQECPDGDFPTCPYPNPEERAALEKALALAREKGADLVLATDPDADRVGVAVRQKDGDYRLLTGNETGVLLENYLLARGEKARPVVVKTIVTTETAAAVAKHYGAELVDVLTGFKYIGETIDRLDDPARFVMGLEESYGYLVGTHARDKDAVSACMTVVEMAAYYKKQGKTLLEVLEALSKQYGYYRTVLLSKSYPGAAGKAAMDGLISALRKSPFAEILGRAAAFADYSEGIGGLPRSDVMAYRTDCFKLVIRPSGTEPKLKLYLEARGETASEADETLASLRDFVSQIF